MKAKGLKQFEEIVNKYQKGIINFHYRFTGDRFEAENLAQETFIKAYLNFKSLKDKKKLQSWLFSIARHTVIDFFRKNKNREIAFGNEVLENLAIATTADFQNQIANNEISKALAICIEQLSPQDKTIIKLLYFEGFSYEEIGKLLNLKPNTLKSRLHRARSILMEMIQGNPLLREVALQYQ